MKANARTRNPSETRQKLVSAAKELVLRQGFSATGVDQICLDAGVTKGAFFHHFKSKDEIGRAALADWASFGMNLYAAAKAEPAVHPLDHVHRFFDIMIGFVENTPTPITCVVGMMSQELANANPALREACATYLGDWTDFARQLLDEAKAGQPPRVDFDSTELAWFLNSLWQGSMLVSKTRRDSEIIVRNLQRARAHIDFLFSGEFSSPKTKSQTYLTMSKYIDGFVLPIPQDKIEAYRKMSTEASKVWKEYGALEYRECVLNDPEAKDCLSFPKLANTTPEETVIFAYITYNSKAHRDEVNAKVMADPRLHEMCGSAGMPFDPARMAYGGFETIVEA